MTHNVCMHYYVFLSDESLLTRRHYNTLNGCRLTDLTCSKAPGFWMVEHQLVIHSVVAVQTSYHSDY